MCMGALMLKKAGINPMMAAVSPALALAGVGKKKKSDKPVIQPNPGGY